MVTPATFAIQADLYVMTLEHFAELQTRELGKLNRSLQHFHFGGVCGKASKLDERVYRYVISSTQT